MQYTRNCCASISDYIWYEDKFLLLLCLYDWYFQTFCIVFIVQT